MSIREIEVKKMVKVHYCDLCETELDRYFPSYVQGQYELHEKCLNQIVEERLGVHSDQSNT